MTAEEDQDAVQETLGWLEANTEAVSSGQWAIGHRLWKVHRKRPWVSSGNSFYINASYKAEMPEALNISQLLQL